jgi:hypothetical protein
VNPLTVVGGLLLLLFLPGFFLLQALFPRRRWFGPFHAFALPAFSVLASLVILVLVGAVLGFLPGGTGGKGWFQGSQTGAPILETTLGALTVILFAAAWARGAFPLLSRSARGLHDAKIVAVHEWSERGEPEEMTLLRDLRLEEERLRKEALRVRQRARESKDVGVRSALTEAADDLTRRRNEVARRARDLERRAGELRYG